MLKVTNISIDLHVLLDEFKLELGSACYACAIIKNRFFSQFKNSRNLFFILILYIVQDIYINLTLKAFYLVSIT